MGHMSFNEWFMRNKFPIIFIIIFILVIIILGFIYLFIHYRHYERDIQRNIYSDEEAHILGIAENFSYGDVFGIDTYEHGNWANFVDSEVIDHYNSEFESLRDEGALHNVHFTYTAQVYVNDNISITYNYEPEIIIEEYPNGEIEIVGDEYVLELSNKTEILIRIEEEFFPNVLSSFNGSNLSHYDQEVDFEINLSNVHLVYQYLDYSDSWSPLDGYGVRIHQIMVIDEEGQPLFIVIDTDQWIS